MRTLSDRERILQAISKARTKAEPVNGEAIQEDGGTATASKKLLSKPIKTDLYCPLGYASDEELEGWYKNK